MDGILNAIKRQAVPHTNFCLSSIHAGVPDTLRWYALARRAPQPPSSKDLCVKLSPNRSKVFLDIPRRYGLGHS